LFVAVHGAPDSWMPAVPEIQSRKPSEPVTVIVLVASEAFALAMAVPSLGIPKAEVIYAPTVVVAAASVS
jgi:hypothetical protein